MYVGSDMKTTRCIEMGTYAAGVEYYSKHITAITHRMST
jgi:hypothetical protein